MANNNNSQESVVENFVHCNSKESPIGVCRDFISNGLKDVYDAIGKKVSHLHYWAPLAGSYALSILLFNINYGKIDTKLDKESYKKQETIVADLVKDNVDFKVAIGKLNINLENLENAINKLSERIKQ